MYPRCSSFDSVWRYWLCIVAMTQQKVHPYSGFSSDFFWFSADDDPKSFNKAQHWMNKVYFELWAVHSYSNNV